MLSAIILSVIVMLNAITLSFDMLSVVARLRKTNALAYFPRTTVARKKSFIALTPKRRGFTFPNLLLLLDLQIGTIGKK